RRLSKNGVSADQSRRAGTSRWSKSLVNMASLSIIEIFMLRRPAMPAPNPEQYTDNLSGCLGERIGPADPQSVDFSRGRTRRPSRGETRHSGDLRRGARAGEGALMTTWPASAPRRGDCGRGPLFRGAK